MISNNQTLRWEFMPECWRWTRTKKFSGCENFIFIVNISECESPIT